MYVINKSMENVLNIKKRDKPLKILSYPHPALRRKSKNVDLKQNFKEIQELIPLMFKTMKFYGGIGLSAPQVGIHLNIVVIDLQDDKTSPIVLINPKILQTDGKIEMEEGCLSFPQMKGYVSRSSKIEIKYHDYEGTEKQEIINGLLAVVIQHEMDHLQGVLFIDHLSKMKREMIFKRMKKTGKL